MSQPFSPDKPNQPDPDLHNTNRLPLPARLTGLLEKAAANSSAKWTAGLCVLVLVLFNLNHCDLAARQDGARADIAGVAAQTKQMADTILAIRDDQASIRLSDSVQMAALQMALDQNNELLRKTRDSSRFYQTLNDHTGKRNLESQSALNSLYISNLNRMQAGADNRMRGILDTMTQKVTQLENAISDSLFTARMAKASFEEVYKTVNFNNKWFDSRIVFGKGDSGKRKGYVSPTFRNSMEADITKYVRPKKGVAGSVTVTVKEANPYAATSSKTFELPIPGFRGKPRKLKTVKAAKNNTRKNQRKNFNKTGG